MIDGDNTENGSGVNDRSRGSKITQERILRYEAIHLIEELSDRMDKYLTEYRFGLKSGNSIATYIDICARSNNIKRVNFAVGGLLVSKIHDTIFLEDVCNFLRGCDVSLEDYLRTGKGIQAHVEK